MIGLRDKTKDLLCRYNIDLSKMVSLTNIAKLTRRCYSGKDILKVVRNFKNILRNKNKVIYKYEENLIDKDITISELNSLISNLNIELAKYESINKEISIANKLISEKNINLETDKLLLSTTIDKMTDKNNKLTIVNKSLEKDLKVIRETNDESLKKKLNECSNFIIKLNNKIERLEKTNTVLKKEVITLKKKNKTI